MEIAPLGGMETTRVFIFVYSGRGIWAHITSGCCCLKLQKNKNKHNFRLISEAFLLKTWLTILPWKTSKQRNCKTRIFINFSEVDFGLLNSTTSLPQAVTCYLKTTFQSALLWQAPFAGTKAHGTAHSCPKNTLYCREMVIWLDTAKSLHATPNYYPNGTSNS